MAGAFLVIYHMKIFIISRTYLSSKKEHFNDPELILFIPQILIVYDNVSNSLYILKHFLSGVKKLKNMNKFLTN